MPRNDLDLMQRAVAAADVQIKPALTQDARKRLPRHLESPNAPPIVLCLYSICLRSGAAYLVLRVVTSLNLERVGRERRGRRRRDRLGLYRWLVLFRSPLCSPKLN